MTPGDVEITNFGQTTDGKITKITSRLHIGQADYSAEGTYQCVISNALGTTFSKKATIVVQGESSRKSRGNPEEILINKKRERKEKPGTPELGFLASVSFH